MFTNVDMVETLAIIKDLYHLVQVTTTVPFDVFALVFSVIFKQVKGLAMGNCLAKILAEIRTNHSLLQVVIKYDASVISFIYKYVDDIFTSVHHEHVDRFCKDIAENVGMEITLSRENDASEVDYLDCFLKRNENRTISARWMKKDYSSFQTLNYHSYHPWHVKKNTASEMISHAYELTTSENLPKTKELLKKVLENSSYPEDIIIDLLDVSPPKSRSFGPMVK